MPGTLDDHLRQPTFETDVIEQDTVMDAGTAKLSDDRTDQGVLRMDQEEGISAEEQARRRLRSEQRETMIEAIRQAILKTVKREASFGTSAQVLRKHQNNEEPRADSCIMNGGDQQEARKKSS